ncbi:MAG: hypothetical protein ACREM1_22490 [Longimicrobiales bacterium]
MTVDQLRSVMKFHLQNFNDEGVAITDAVKHSVVLSENDGFSTGTSSKAAYKAFIRNTFSRNGHPDIKWPADWMERTVDELATQLLSQEVVA